MSDPAALLEMDGVAKAFGASRGGYGRRLVW